MALKNVYDHTADGTMGRQRDVYIEAKGCGLDLAHPFVGVWDYFGPVFKEGIEVDISGAVKEIKAGKYRTIYLLAGQDRYRMAQFVEFVTSSMFAVDEREMGLVKFDTAESSLEDIILEAETPPFFLEKKLIVVRDQTVMAAGSKEGSKIEHKTDLLVKYIDSPMESTVLLFQVHADKADERRKLVKLIKDRDSLLMFSELDHNQTKQWVSKYAAEQNRKITGAAAELLISRVGVQLQRLSQEMDKLCLHVGQDGVIEEETVRMLTSVSVEEDVFALVDAIAELQIARALQMYKELLIRREEPIKIAALIARQIRIMLQIKELEQHHYSPQQMAGHIGQHPYTVKLAAEKGKKFTVHRLGAILSELAELDFKMKSGQMDKELGMELFLLSLQK